MIPTVIREGDITKIKMKVTIENNSRSNTTVNLGTTAGAPPVINKRRAQTEVLIKEGERLVIGGVTTNLDQDETRKIPILRRHSRPRLAVQADGLGDHRPRTGRVHHALGPEGRYGAGDAREPEEVVA